MAEQPTLSAGQVVQVTRLMEEALQQYGARQDTEISKLREGAIAIIDVNIPEATELRVTLEQEMESTTNGCKALFAQVLEESNRT